MPVATKIGMTPRFTVEISLLDIAGVPVGWARPICSSSGGIEEFPQSHLIALRGFDCGISLLRS
jgi:hypothetical protein